MLCWYFLLKRDNNHIHAGVPVIGSLPTEYYTYISDNVVCTLYMPCIEQFLQYSSSK